MKRTGVTNLPLHGGKAPSWLVDRMIKLADPIVKIIIDEYGRTEFLERISDPHWFQALGCVLGYDWHSSGLTTVTTGVLKEAIDPEETGIFVAGGKEKKSLNTPKEIEKNSNKFNFSDKEIENFKYASRMGAKVDNSAIQANSPLYHHAFFWSEDGKWSIVQQGMNTAKKTARRYHWLSNKVENFVKEPHKGIVAQNKCKKILDMTAENSEGCRKTSTDLVNDGPDLIKREFKTLLPKEQKSLDEWISKSKTKKAEVTFLSMPKRMNWKALEKTYELQPRNFEELLDIKGIGPATVRGLALVSELIHGEPASKKDPAKFSYAFGGKDGVPYPVNREAMDKAHQTLKNAIEESKIGKKEKLKAVKRLKTFYRIEPTNKTDR